MKRSLVLIGFLAVIAGCSAPTDTGTSTTGEGKPNAAWPSPSASASPSATPSAPSGTTGGTPSPTPTTQAGHSSAGANVPTDGK